MSQCGYRQNARYAEIDCASQQMLGCISEAEKTGKIP
jgi:hypothetical protein